MGTCKCEHARESLLMSVIHKYGHVLQQSLIHAQDKKNILVYALG